MRVVGKVALMVEHSVDCLDEQMAASWVADLVDLVSGS
jgi:hypothetical protein